MESAYVTKSDEKKATHAVSSILEPAAPRSDAGAMAGMPIFLGRSPLTGSEAASEEPETESEIVEQGQEEPLAIIQRETQEDETENFTQVNAEVVQRQTEVEEPESSEPTDELLQTKLAVNEPGDAYEQEADQVADIVMRKADSSVEQITPDPSADIQRKCETCEEEEQQVQRKVDASSSTPTVIGSLQPTDAGTPLSPDVRQQIEPVLGADLSHVRVHQDMTARQTAKSLHAKAFTHQEHIWLGENQAANDVELMAHETTHVIQQTAGSAPVQMLQRKPSDYQHPEDGGNVDQRLQQRFAEEIDVNPDTVESSATEVSDPARQTTAVQATQTVDSRALEAKESELKSETQPDVDRPAEESPQIEEAAQATEQEVNAPTEPLAEGEQPDTEAEAPSEGEATDAATQAANLAEQAFAAAQTQPEPMPEPEVIPPEPVAPIDSAGMPLPANPAAELAIADLAERAQVLREGGFHLRQKATEERSNADILRGNLQVAQGGISQAEAGISTSQEHLEVRQELVTQAEDALAVSEEKATTVATEAPTFSEQAEEGKEDSGPMSAEASEMASENQAKTPRDSKAASKSREQGQKINQIGADAATMDDAITQTHDQAGALAEDAAHAAEMNAQTQEQIAANQDTLTQTSDRLTEMQEQTTAAQTQVEEMSSAPDEMATQANGLDQQAQALITASYELEERLAQTQQSYAQGMQAVPALKPWEGESSETETVQLSPEADAVLLDEPEVSAAPDSLEVAPSEMDVEPLEAAGDDEAFRSRETVDLSQGLPPWLTGIDPLSEERQEEARQRQEEQRQNEIDQINEWADGRFEDLNAGEKVGIAIGLLGQRFYNAIANIEWPGWAGLAKALLDPRSSLAGVVSGLSMMLSGAANLFSAEQWAQDPLGNLLKSAADIATGLTIVLASITALAGAIAAAMGALMLVTLGGAAPIAVPVITFCTTVMTTVGGWTIAVGKIALILQGLSLIKNLVDAATAETAEELQRETGEIGEDVGKAFAVTMSIVGAKGAQSGAQRLTQRVGSRAAARTTAKALPGQIAGGARAVGRGVVGGSRAVGRGVVRGTQAVGRGLASGGRAVGRGFTAATRSTMQGLRSVRDRARRFFGREIREVEPGVLARRRTASGHNIKITRGGRIVRCSTCEELATRYEGILERRPDLQRRLREIEGNASNPSRAAQAAEDAARLEADLQRAERQFVRELLRDVDTDQAVDDAFRAGRVTHGPIRPIDRSRSPEQRLDLQGPTRPGGQPEVPGQILSRNVAQRARQVLQRRISDNSDVMDAWQRARQRVLQNRGPLTQQNYVQLYNSTRNRFWKEVFDNPNAKQFFENGGFTFPRRGRAPVLAAARNQGVPIDEFRISLDHIAPKARGNNWTRALDGDNLQFVTQAENTMLQNLEVRHPTLGR